MTQKKNKKRNPMAIQLKHWRHQVIKNKKKYNRKKLYENK
jgi:hypothetical protein|tara:strand:+ start:870 stop:989 length:120 start_codon:yes stop_codon:yes gene_type:complete